MKIRVVLYTAIIFLVSLFDQAEGQPLGKDSFRLKGVSASGPRNNTINDILIVGNDVWVGAADLTHTTDNGQTWISYTDADGLGKGNISAIEWYEDVIWIATAYDTTTELGTFDAGGGLAYSEDGGTTWHWVPQPVDSAGVTEYHPTTTNIQNLTYDIALTDSTVWIASFGGGLRKSNDMGSSWQVVTVDGNPFEPLSFLAHRAFAVHYDGHELWAGTAGGIHKSTDGGESWTTYNHQNQPDGISGNFVVAIGHQHIQGKKVIWAATVEALDENELRGVSRTEDGGLTWTVHLENHFAHNFGFDEADHAVYVATDDGLFLTPDQGQTWASFPQIVDFTTGEGIYTTSINAVGVTQDGVLWVGSSDGLAKTADGGATWQIYRSFQVPGKDGTPETYAYPNPFSPMRHNQIDGDGYVRFQYRLDAPASVDVHVYDFGMNLVCTVLKNKYRSVSGDYNEVWNGKNDMGDMVANGVYFYKISISDGSVLWGKVMVVN